MERFEELLKELGVQLGLPLHPDRRGACALVVNDLVQVQIECNLSQENLLIAAFICEIPPGKFRENILKDALKANYPHPKNGTLAYSDRNNQLALFSYLPFANLHGPVLAEFLAAFAEKAISWRTGVETGQTASLIPTVAKTTGNIFGIKS